MTVKRELLPLHGVLIAMLLAVRAASAQPSDSAAQANATGRRLFEKGDYLSAAEAFQQAYRLRPHFLLQCNIATCYENRSDAVKAAEHYRRCLAEGGRASPKAAEIRQALKGVEAQIGWVSVSCRGGGAAFVDGRPVGAVPARVPLNPGEHAVEVRRGGLIIARISIRVRSGDESSLDLSAEEPHPAARSRPAPAEATAPAVVESKPESATWKRGLGWTAVACGGGLLVTGIISGVMVGRRSDEHAQAAEQGRTYFELNEIRASGERYEALQLGAYIAGGALLAAGGGLLIWDALEHRRMRGGAAARIHLWPVGGPGRAALIGLTSF